MMISDYFCKIIIPFLYLLLFLIFVKLLFWNRGATNCLLLLSKETRFLLNIQLS